MPGQALVRQRPLSGELEASMEEGAWLPDPIAHKETRRRTGPEATEARLFGWGELLGTWVEHLLTAIDIAVLGERVPTLLALLDRNDEKSQRQLKSLKRFKVGVQDAARVFVLYTHEFDWLFQAWAIKELPMLMLFGSDGAAENRVELIGPLDPTEIAQNFTMRLSVNFTGMTFEEPEDQDDDGSWYLWPLRGVRRLIR